ncbi:hypothetical protein ABIE65_001392 [Constrictibacter sp. MBR-5]|jgi:hypothetical protein|uniref:hypothetical protein n=1 Tax=Constrictibacter sp. MBR-5 TaxID=3156467 RepID=UPI0033990727
MSGELLAPADRQRLAKICGLLGSDHDGERASAARAATAILLAAGLTWEQLILAVAPEPAAEPQRDPTDDALAYLRDAVIVDEWSQHFVASLRRLRAAGRELTEKQKAKLYEVAVDCGWSGLA